MPSAGSVTFVTRQRPEAHWLSVAQAGALLAGAHSGLATVAFVRCSLGIGMITRHSRSSEFKGGETRGGHVRFPNSQRRDDDTRVVLDLRSQAWPLAHS